MGMPRVGFHPVPVDFSWISWGKRAGKWWGLSSFLGNPSLQSLGIWGSYSLQNPWESWAFYSLQSQGILGNLRPFIPFHPSLHIPRENPAVPFLSFQQFPFIPAPAIPPPPETIPGIFREVSNPNSFPVFGFFSRRFLRETLKMSNAEDLNRLTACSLVLLGHIFYVLGNHRVIPRSLPKSLPFSGKNPTKKIPKKIGIWPEIMRFFKALF